jgi:hypothetical protein
VERRKPKRPPLKFEEIDERCRADILLAARGENSAWPADNYPTTHGGRRLSYQERLVERDDKQMMLWAIVLAAEDGEETPPWAIDSLKRAMIEMAAGASWASVFGRETAERGNNKGANPDSLQRRAEYQYRVWDFINERMTPGQKGKLYDAAADEFHISRTLVVRYYSRMKRFYRKKNSS